MPKLKIIFEDPHLLVLDKPPGLVVTPEGFTQGETVSDILQKDFHINLDRGGVVHRLDKDTSGILLVGKTQPALEQLKSQFFVRSVKKQYLALVHGILDQEGIIDAAILRNPQNKIKFDVLEGGRESVTFYKPLEQLKLSDQKLSQIFPDLNKPEIKKLQLMGYQNYTLISCSPQTGRTHQIRVHLKYINHPILGDTKYAGRKNSKLDPLWCQRQFLHAAKIEFTHPITGAKLIFESPLPDDLKEVLSYLNNG